ncbi:MAG: UDP-4-amino-4,6-dideoxy-N-acetyl-beta-L-altrosamine transaminase [Paraglaciecola polaris]|uniref:UDP-4-amino-4, 6-dideoxy-N-acetyl-beta-L-altrosamine transaminase n=1 Tax=Paraglaciecola polaris TaxID=222814 RepID=UPI003002C96E|tara:strand:+ start:6059 stop:7195 length:1137 start_codon:yes stop_codon:yes gene_type:complete
MLPYGRHAVDQDDIDAVVDVLKNQLLTQGTAVPAFESALCKYTQANYALAVNSGTSGLHVACLAAGVGPSDLVWTVPNSFVASANCARYCGADVDFVDIDPLTRNISVECLKIKLANCRKFPKALIVVHFAGASCEMQTIAALMKKHNIVLIEDAAHALGATYQDKPVGSCHFSDMTVLSFHPVKSITSAEGGAITTNNKGFIERLTLFAKHGITREPSSLEDKDQGAWYYEQQELGYNYRMSDLHGALGLSQLNKLNTFIQHRREKAGAYLSALRALPIKLPSEDALATSAWHLFMIELIKHDRKQVFNALRDRGLGVNVHYIPIHRQPYYQKLGFEHGDFPNAEHFYQGAITLPLFPTMTEIEQQYVIDTLIDVLQ